MKTTPSRWPFRKRDGINIDQAAFSGLLLLQERARGVPGQTKVVGASLAEGNRPSKVLRGNHHMTPS